MCHECGCQAVAVIKSLMDDHTAIAARVGRIDQALERHRFMELSALTAELAETFAHHDAVEEAGIFDQLRHAGKAAEAVTALADERRRLSSGLVDPAVITNPDQLRNLLGSLLRYAQVEDEELYPVALQVLPNERWGRIEDVHQLMLTG